LAQERIRDVFEGLESFRGTERASFFHLQRVSLNFFTVVHKTAGKNNVASYSWPQNLLWSFDHVSWGAACRQRHAQLIQTNVKAVKVIDVVLYCSFFINGYVFGYQVRRTLNVLHLSMTKHNHKVSSSAECQKKGF